jgi:predicted small lipoprotein YifL
MVHAMQDSVANRPVALRLAMIGALAAALLLSGCGRKGPLDPPPGALASQPAPGAAATPGDTVIQQDPDGDRPAAAPGQPRRLPIDVLLN